MITTARTCRDCGYVYQCPDDWYLDRGLALPSRCPSCRAARRAARVRGTVTYFDLDRGFGFLVDDAAGRRIYFTHSDVDALDLPLTAGARVEFRIVPSSDGRAPRAKSVTVVQSPPAER